MTAHSSVRGDVAVLVPAAGMGVRLGPGAPKALRLLRGEPLLVHAVRRVAAAPSVGCIVVAAPADAVDDVIALLSPVVALGTADSAAAGLVSGMAGVSEAGGTAVTGVAGVAVEAGGTRDDAGVAGVDAEAGGTDDAGVAGVDAEAGGTRDDAGAAGVDTEAGGTRDDAGVAGVDTEAAEVSGNAGIARAARVAAEVGVGNGTRPLLIVVAGGASRQASVAAALAAVPEQFGIVLVHDAARALTPPELVEAVADAVRGGHGAVIPVLPVVDTIKQVDDSGIVIGTVDRSVLRAVQTPQGFRRDVLTSAHAAAVDEHTDDAGMAEKIGVPVHTVPGAEAAMKITRPFDLAVAELLF